MVPLNRAARRAAQSRRKTVGVPFGRAFGMTAIGSAVSYRHPTKGLRFRRLTPQLFAGLIARA